MSPRDKRRQPAVGKGLKREPQGQPEELLQHGANGPFPLNVLREAIRAVPAVKYALGVAGIAAAVSIVAGFRINLRVAVLGVVIMLGLMTVLVIFSSFARSGIASLKQLGLILAWPFVFLTVATAFFIFTGFFFSWPRPLDETAARITGKVVGSTPTPSLMKLSGNIEQIEISQHPDGGAQVFISLSIKNEGQSTPVQQYSLQITKVNSENNSKDIDVNVQSLRIKNPITLPAERVTLPPLAGNYIGEMIIQPQDAIAYKTEHAVLTNEKVTGWLRFSAPLPTLNPEALRRPGTKYIVTFTDSTGATYQASYEIF
jgi:hypothetical protein